MRKDADLNSIKNAVSAVIILGVAAVMISTSIRGAPQKPPRISHVSGDFEYPGVVRSEPSSTLIESPVSGRIEFVAEGEGKVVKAGAVIAHVQQAAAVASIERIRLELAAHYVHKAALSAALQDGGSIEIAPLELTDVEPSVSALAALDQLILAQQDSLTEQRKYQKQKLEIGDKHIEAISRKLDFQKYIRGKTMDQLANLTAERQRISVLVARGAFPVNRDSDLARQEMALQARIAEADAALADIEIEKENVRLANYESMKSRREDTFTRLEDVIAKIGDAKGRLNEVQNMLQRSEIRAPHDGHLRNFRVQVSGMTVIAGEPLVEVTLPNQSFLVEATVPSEDLAAIQKGGTAGIRPGPRATMQAPLIPATLDGLMSSDTAALDGDNEPQTVYFSIEEGQVPPVLRSKFRTGYSVSVSIQDDKGRHDAISALQPPVTRAQALVKALGDLASAKPASIHIALNEAAIPRVPKFSFEATLNAEAPLRRLIEFFKGSLDRVRVAVKDVIVAQHYAIHVRAQVAGYGFGRSVNHRLLPVEARVQENRDAGDLGVLFNDAVVTRVGLAIDGLDTARAVHMRGRWDERDLVWPDLRRHCHEGIGVLVFEEFVQALDENYWCKRSERFAMLDAGVDQVLHRVRRRGREDGTVAERARPNLGPPLKPPDDFLFA